MTHLHYFTRFSKQIELLKGTVTGWPEPLKRAITNPEAQGGAGAGASAGDDSEAKAALARAEQEEHAAETALNLALQAAKTTHDQLQSKVKALDETLKKHAEIKKRQQRFGVGMGFEGGAERLVAFNSVEHYHPLQ